MTEAEEVLIVKRDVELLWEDTGNFQQAAHKQIE